MCCCKTKTLVIKTKGSVIKTKGSVIKPVVNTGIKCEQASLKNSNESLVNTSLNN